VAATVSPTSRRSPELWRGLAWAAFALLLAMQVYVLYLASGVGAPPFRHADKLVHVVIFALPAVLAALLDRGWALGVLVVHAVVSEPVQAWATDGRLADVWDTVAGLVGIVLGVLVVRSVRRGRGVRR
jgi:hypothetical protein